MASSINASTSGAGGVITTADSSGVLNIQTAGNTAVTVDASQNVGIGTASPVEKLTISGSISASGDFVAKEGTTARGYVFGNSTGLNLRAASGLSHIFDQAGTEVTRIDSNGNLLIGTTDTANTSGNGIKLNYGVQQANTPSVGVVGASTSSSHGCYLLYSSTGSAYKFYVTYAGVVNATTTTITAISDQRLKENIRDLDDGLEKVMLLKPRKFDWKEGKGENIKNARGFIAQEIETVFPDMISTWMDEVPKGEEPYKAVNANLIPTLVKAIQEQQTIINDLKARIETLEGAK